MSLLGIEMFRGLSNMELAQVLGKLEKRVRPSGAELFRQGDPGGSLFIIERGKVQLYSEMADGSRQPLALLGEGDTLGEMALLTGEPRSATAVTAAESVLYEMDNEAFGQLIADKTSISAYFIRLLSQRLVQTNDRLQSSKEAQTKRVLEEADKLPPELERMITACAMLPYADQGLAKALLGVDRPLAELVAAHSSLLEFIRPDEEENGAARAQGRFRLHPRVKPIVSERYLGRHTEQETAGWLRQAAEYWLARGDWASAAAIYAERGDWEAALNIAERQGTEATATGETAATAETESETVPDTMPETLPEEAKPESANVPKTAETATASGYELLDRCPAELLLPRFSVLARYAKFCAERGREAGLAAIEAALDRRASFTYAPEQTALLYETAAELYEAIGQRQKAIDCLRKAEAIARSPQEAAESEERAYRLAKQKLEQEKSKELASRAASLLKGKRWSGLAAAVVVLASLLFFHFAEPFGGLSRHGMDFIGIGIAAVALWMVNVIPDYLVALLMAMAWVLGGLVAPEVALSGFASTTWLYMLFILAIGAAITKSGILYRLSLHALKRFPAHYRGQLRGIVAGGIALNPLIPSSSAKVSLGVPIARTLSESMGFRDRSHGSAGLGLAAMVFYGFTAPFVLTGSYTNVMAFGLVSGAKPPNWFEWFYYALPAFVIFAVIMLVLMRFMFTKTSAGRPISRQVLDDQLRILGKWTKDERWTVGTVIVCIALLILQPLHGIDNAWVMLLGFAALLLTGALDTQTLKNGVDWTFLLFIGIAFSFAEAAKELGIVQAMSEFLGKHMAGFIGSPALFLAVVMLLSFAVTLVVRDDPAVILLVIAMLPLSEQAGIDPWVLVFAILLATDPFFFAYQSPTYLTAYYSAEGKAFSHRQGQRVAFAYALAVIVAVVASVPYWQWLGLIHK